MVSGGLTYNLTGLSSFTNYSISVAASNEQGEGSLSEEAYAALVDGKCMRRRGNREEALDLEICIRPCEELAGYGWSKS